MDINCFVAFYQKIRLYHHLCTSSRTSQQNWLHYALNCDKLSLQTFAEWQNGPLLLCLKVASLCCWCHSELLNESHQSPPISLPSWSLICWPAQRPHYFLFFWRGAAPPYFLSVPPLMVLQARTAPTWFSLPSVSTLVVIALPIVHQLCVSRFSVSTRLESVCLQWLSGIGGDWDAAQWLNVEKSFFPPLS